MFRWVGTAFVSFSLCAAPAGAVTLAGIGRCADAPDQAMCLLTLAGGVRGGADVRADRELAGRPELLKQAGVATSGATASPAPETPSEDDDPFLRLRMATNAALALDKAERPPQDALVPLRDAIGALPPKGQAMAYRFIFAQADRAMSPALRAALLADWEATLKARAAGSPGNALDRTLTVDNEALMLALIYAAEEDQAGVDRALALVSQENTGARIGFLAAVGRFDQALAVVRAEQARLDAAAPADDLEARANIEDARTALLGARIMLAAAAADAGKLDLARPLADALLVEAGPVLASGDFPTLAAAATPAVAEPLLDRLEKEATDATEHVFASVPAPVLAQAWLKIGRKDRFEALVVWLKVHAKDDPEVADALGRLLFAAGRTEEAAAYIDARSLDDLLEADFEEGRGLVNLDRYLAIAEKSGSPEALLSDCAQEAGSVGDFRAMHTCLARLLTVVPDSRSGDVAFMALYAAGETANEELAVARDLAAVAIAAARRAPPMLAGPMDEEMAGPVIEIAKMMLRADGRLPALAVSSER